MWRPKVWNQQKKKGGSTWRWVLELVVLFAAVFIITQLLMTFVISKDEVQGSSMEPGLQQNDRLISLRHKQIKRNDIVVVYAPDATDKATGKPELYIKRVIGMPGDTVQSKNDKLYINGKLVKQPYLHKKFMRKEIKAIAAQEGLDASKVKFTYDFSLKTLKSTHRTKVPKGEYFVMGDNRIISHDGRAFGFLKRSQIQSVVVMRYWPMSKFKFY
ncbi:signal peptidase I [Lacticaseibacillus thailandensis]|uniref:signal peptidase I n=1 Tax=Lacticaseibacillus thailandensis TaxID=381741 RepID=UPI0006D06A00|nr:signal peptidase I [Lacticaseibacillus thailandensis]